MELREDDVVQPVAGILDVLDNYAFVRTSGYLAGTNDVYVSMNMVRKNGLRRGDAITGAVRVAREGEGGNNSNSQNPRQKFNPLVRLDSVNGGPVEDARNRPDFQKLTPLYPNQRLRLETKSELLTTRVIDLIMPIGKGQRALIVSPPKAGKTMVLQSIANAITVNNPECHLMVVLVDERPEEVTDMQRSVKGEVIASTFDRPPSDHTAVAELAIERAKRLVEQGKDVVVLLDSITRLGRAYNNASPASGRILSGGVDSTALYPPKRFLGAARNIEDGGSLTIIATALVETGSMGDTVIYEEFKGTGNAELKLDRKIAERRVFPAVDVNPSNTRKDELLLSSDEFAVVHKLRRVLSGLDSHQAIDLLMSQLRKTKNNYEFLVQVSKNTPGTDSRLSSRQTARAPAPERRRGPSASGQCRVGAKAGHHVATNVGEHGVVIGGIEPLPRHRGQRQQRPGDPFRSFCEVHVGMDLTAVPGDDEVSGPELAKIRHQALDARASTRREVFWLLHPELHQKGAGVRVGGAPVPDPRGDLFVEAVDLFQHGVRVGPERVVQSHDGGPEQGVLVGKVPIEPPPRHAGHLGDLGHGRRPDAFARRHVSAASISRSRTLFDAGRGAVALVKGGRLFFLSAADWDGCILPVVRRYRVASR